ncbi:MAG: chemotaxis response regulator protein-glutamate methylesterase [Rhizobiales bacterium]|nr:chemotaxis response regulator protein-glutamate methylesterase [Hyphomicrobiales bacterium]
MSVSDKYLKSRSSNQKVSVMIVDDSVVVRGLFSKWLEDVSDIVVVATHRNGKLAVDNIAKDKPDIVLLDIEMPVMDGITALPLLLKAYPAAKIIISSTLTTRNAEISLKAMELGAIDYVAKPEGSGSLTSAKDFKAELIQKVRVFGGIVDPCRAGEARNTAFKATTAVRPVISGVNAASRARYQAPKPQIRKTSPLSVVSTTNFLSSTASRAIKKTPTIALHRASKMMPKAIVIGSSTGGPPALLELTKAITADIDHIPVFITQHMPASFTKILAEHIKKVTGRECKEGEDGENVQNGVIYIAPGGKHMSLTGSGFAIKIKLDNGPQINYCKPSVDPLFETASQIYKKAILSVILTGMGNDGTGGAEKIIEQGGTVIVQDEETSVVWGMPGAAVQKGVVSEILPLNKIGARVSSLVRGKM